MKSITGKLLLAAALTAGTAGFVQAQTPTYQFIKKISLPGDGKWDYLKMDGERERLFVSHFDKVHVIDLTTDKQIGEIDDLKGVHGIGLAKELAKGYITNGASNTVTVFDYNTFKVIKTIALSGKKPDCVIYDKPSEKIYAFCGGSQNVSVIDAHTDNEVGTISLGGNPEFAVSDGKGLIYDNLEDKNEVVVIDVKQQKVVNRFPLMRGVAPTGITMDNVTNRLFVACNDSKNLLVLDAINGKQVAALPIGGKVDAVVFEKDLKLVITSNGEGNTTIIQQKSADEYVVAQTLVTHPGLKTLVHRGTTHNIFISGAEMQDKQIKPGTFGVYVYGPAK